MTQEEKQLLLIDLSARLPYKVKGIYARTNIKNLSICEITTHLYGGMEESFNGKEKYEFIPYLRPMSSMTEEEKKELKSATCPEGTGYFDEQYLICPMSHFGEHISYSFMSDILNWLNAHHFDYRGLISMGLALEAPEGMYENF